MKILVACEESGVLTEQLRKLGHEAYSCDIEPTSGNLPQYHLQQDVIPLLKEKWDMIFAFPPCTYFSTAGANWLFRGGELNQERYAKGLEMKALFMDIYNADCDKIVIENPVSMKIWELPVHSQEIQPHDFYGEHHPYTKKTRLWLKGVLPLVPVESVEPIAKWVGCGNSSNREKQNQAVCKSSGTGKKRSKTFIGIAKAMAEQWAGAL